MLTPELGAARLRYPKGHEGAPLWPLGPRPPWGGPAAGERENTF